MTTIDLWLTLSEGVAIMLLAGSLGLMIRTRKAGGWPGSVAPASPGGSPETLRQLVEESQALCADLLNNLDERKALAHGLAGQMDEKISRLSRLLTRVEDDPEPGRPAANRNRYVEAIGLAEDGLPPAEIGKRLNLTKGEVQLLLDLKAYCLK